MYKVKVENINQLEITLKAKNVSEIILARDSFGENDLPKLVDKIKMAGKIAWILMERISRYEEKRDAGSMMSDRAKKQNVKKGHYEQYSLRLSTDKVYDIENLDGIIIQNIDSFAYMLRKINMVANDKLMVEINYTMNCYNSETKKVLETLYNEKRNNSKKVPLLFTAPVELNIYELCDVGYDTFVVYSYVDTMVSANCLYKNTHNASCLCGGNKRLSHLGIDSPNNHRGEQYEPANSFYILDRKNKKLHYKVYCKYCYNKIFNTEPLYLLDKVDEIESIYYNRKKTSDKRIDILDNINSTNSNNGRLKYRIDFSFEDEKAMKNILNSVCPESFTRGHFKTSIK